MKEKSTLFNFVLNAILTLAIYFFAQMGKSLGLQGELLPVTLVWLPTGLSLAALLLFGTVAWPGILLGNLAYNVQELYVPNEWVPIVVAGVISLGFLLQALIADRIMRTYCTPGYFNTVKDVLIFLFPAGIFCCLIASTIGTVALNFIRPLSQEEVKAIWPTYWIGDTFGVYLLTPLLVVWMKMKKGIQWPKERVGEILLMILAFLFITLLIDYYAFPMYHLYILLNIWVAYRFGLKGVTLSMFLIGLAIIVPFAAGFGFFRSNFGWDPLLAIVLFLEVLVCASLIVGAISQEKSAIEEAMDYLNRHLSESLKSQEDHMEFGKGETQIKNKLSTISLLVLGLIRLLEIPMKRINVFAKNSLGLLDKTDLDPDTKYATIKNFINEISESESKGYEIIKAIERQSSLSTQQALKVQKVDLSQILENSIDGATKEAHKKYPMLSYVISEELDRSIKVGVPVPDNLSKAIEDLILMRVQLVKERVDQDEVRATLKIKTKDQKHKVEIVIEDNGKPLSPILADYLTNVFQKKQTIEDLGVTLAHDTIVYLYRGTIQVAYENGIHKISIQLPKE